MKLSKEIHLVRYLVEYIDRRQPKPRTIHREFFVLDGGRISALRRLGGTPAGFIESEYLKEGFCISSIARDSDYTVLVDIAALWPVDQEGEANE